MFSAVIYIRRAQIYVIILLQNDKVFIWQREETHPQI